MEHKFASLDTSALKWIKVELLICNRNVETQRKYYTKRKGYTWIVVRGMKYDVCRESQMVIGLTEEQVKRMDELVLTDPSATSLYIKYESEVGVTHK